MQYQNYMSLVVLTDLMRGIRNVHSIRPSDITQTSIDIQTNSIFCFYTKTSPIWPKCKFNFLVLDSSGTYKNSFVWGQNAWLGSKEQCDFLNEPAKFIISSDVPKLMDKHLISTTSPIEMEFKMIFLIITSPLKIDPIISLRVGK